MLKSKKQKLTELLRPIVKSILSEGPFEGYVVTYFETGGGHGDTGRRYSDFNTAVKAAVVFSQDKNGAGENMMEGLEYLGVEPYANSKEFSVLFCTPNYLRIGAKGFNDPEDAKVWLSVAKKVANSQQSFSGKPLMPRNGKFN